MSLGFTYNTILNTVGFLFEIWPNLVPEDKRIPGAQGSALSSLQQGH